MIDEKGAIVGPDHFMSAAQRYQLMPTIDRWVIGRAIEMLKPHSALLDAGSIVFTINFSGQSLQDPDFTEHVAKLIEESGINPAALCFELTESAAIGNLARAEVLMRRLRKLGCNIALDDFGTGLSSLAYLRTLPIGMLKIDGSFVRDVLKDPRAESMVQTIAQLARAMSLTTVAEYVETDEIRARITALGVDYGQGFAIAKPEPLAEVLAELPLYVAAAAPGRGLASGRRRIRRTGCQPRLTATARARAHWCSATSNLHFGRPLPPCSICPHANALSSDSRPAGRPVARCVTVVHSARAGGSQPEAAPVSSADSAATTAAAGVNALPVQDAQLFARGAAARPRKLR